MDLAALKAELVGDPAGLGYGSGTDEVDASLLNDPILARPVTVEPDELDVFGKCDRDGYWGRISLLADMVPTEIAAEYAVQLDAYSVTLVGSTALAPTLARSAAQGARQARDRRMDPQTTNLDVTADAFGQLLDLFVAMGVMAQAQADALVALGTRVGSRAEELFGEGSRVTPSDCADARRLP